MVLRYILSISILFFSSKVLSKTSCLLDLVQKIKFDDYVEESSFTESHIREFLKASSFDDSEIADVLAFLKNNRNLSILEIKQGISRLDLTIRKKEILLRQGIFKIDSVGEFFESTRVKMRSRFIVEGQDVSYIGRRGNLIPSKILKVEEDFVILKDPIGNKATVSKDQLYMAFTSDQRFKAVYPAQKQIQTFGKDLSEEILPMDLNRLKGQERLVRTIVKKNKGKITDEAIRENNKYILDLQKELKKQGISSSVYLTKGGYFDLKLNGVHENGNKLARKYMKLAQQQSVHSMTISLIETTKKRVLGFYDVENRRVEIGSESAYSLLKKKNSETIVHELKHVLGDNIDIDPNQKNIWTTEFQTTEGVSKTTLHGDDINTKRLKGYDDYLSLDEILTYLGQAIRSDQISDVNIAVDFINQNSESTYNLINNFIKSSYDKKGFLKHDLKITDKGNKIEVVDSDNKVIRIRMTNDEIESIRPDKIQVSRPGKAKFDKEFGSILREGTPAYNKMLLSWARQMRVNELAMQKLKELRMVTNQVRAISSRVLASIDNDIRHLNGNKSTNTKRLLRNLKKVVQTYQ